jgi:hypothetical protein
MSVKKITEQTVKWTSTGLLTTGVIISTGLLSFCGMLFIHPSLALAWIAFGLAGFVDGEVYKQNIAQGIDNIKLLGTRGIDILIIKSLEERLKNSNDTWFEKEYKNQKKYIDSFTHKKLNAEQKINKKNAIKRLRRMQKFFVKCVLSGSKNDECLETLTSPIQKELATFKRKRWYLRASIPICLGAGAGFGFATASSLYVALAGIGMTAALSATVWPLAAIACIGYAFLIYHTIADIICNDTFQKWKEKVKTWFHRKEKENNLKFGLRVTGLALLLVLTMSVGVIATLATAGTWWMAVKNGALLLPIFAAAANHIRNLLVPLASVTNFVFTIKNSLKSVKNILTIKPKEAFKKKKEEIKEFIEKETLLQLLNPFRIITKLISLPFMFIVFIGHIIAVGLTGDRTPGLNYGETITGAICGAISDGAVDFPYVFGQEHGHDHEHADPEHDHNHGLIADWVLKVTLSPLLLLSAIYSFLVSKNPKSSENFKKELKNSFGINGEKPYVEERPEFKRDATWIQKEIKLRFEKQRSKTTNPNEENTLNTLETEVTTNFANPKHPLNVKGLFRENSLGQTFADKIKADYFRATGCAAAS